jgi:hypothetical protein
MSTYSTVRVIKTTEGDEVYVCRDTVTPNIRLSVNDADAVLTVENAVALIAALADTVNRQCRL